MHDFASHVRVIAYNERGYRIGATHHNATIPDEQVAMVLELHAAGLGYRRIAHRLAMNCGTVRDIVLLRRRASVPHHFVRVRVVESQAAQQTSESKVTKVDE